MKGSAKLVMGATLILVVSLAIVLALILVLLAELYCSLLFRKRRYRTNTATTTPAATSPQASLHSSTTSVQLSNVYAHGVFLAPRNILYPSIVHKQEEEICKNQQKHQFFKPYDHQSHHHHHQVLEILSLDPNNTPSPFSSLTASPATMQQIHHQEAAESEITNARVNIGSSVCGAAADEHLVYISNPIYDNELSYKHSGVAGGGESGICSNATPFETPESSPSHLEMDWEEEDAEEHRRNGEGSLELSPNSSLETMTPPLTPMKKLLPMEACSSVSVSLRDARSIDTSGSSHGLSCSSSLSTSPSWCD